MTNIDPYYHKFDGIGFPNHYKKIEMPAGFNIYLLSHTSNKSLIFVYTDRKEFNLSSKRVDADVFRLFANFSSRVRECDKANDLFDYYHSDEIHVAHHAKFEGNNVPVYRIRKSDLRLYLIFLGPDIVLFRLSTKRKDRIDKSEEETLNKRVQAIYSYPIGSKDFLRRVL